MKAEQITFSRSMALNLDQAKTQPETEYNPASRRISTQQIVLDTIPISETERKLDNKTIDLPSIQSARDNRPALLSQMLHYDVEKLIEREITDGKIEVPQTQKIYKLHRKQPKQQASIDPQLKMKKKLMEMEKKRLQAIHMLKLIETQQSQIKRQSVSIKFSIQSLSRSRIKKERSHFSPEQKKVVKQMLQRQNMLETQLSQKTINFKLKQLQKIETQRQRHATEMEKQRSLHRSFIEENKPKVDEQKLERFRSIKSGKKQLQEVKNKRYFYQTVEEQNQRLALEELQELNKKLQAIKSKMRITIVEELKQHKEKYQKIMISRTEAHSMKKSVFLTTNSNNPQVKKFQENYFTRLAKQERETKRKEEEMARSKVFELKRKAKQFADHCSSQIRPKIKVTVKSKFVPPQSHKSVHALNFVQQQKKGNQYLSVAKKLKKCQTLQDEKILNTKNLQTIEKTAYKSSYRNYLTEIKRMPQNNPEQSDRKKFSMFLEKQGTISEYQTLHKAITKAQSIHAISKKSHNQKLIDAVQNKIELLKMIM